MISVHLLTICFLLVGIGYLLEKIMKELRAIRQIYEKEHVRKSNQAMRRTC